MNRNGHRNLGRNPASGGRSRIGKIARLPKTIRDELNSRIQDGEPGKSLVAWLNSIPKVKAVLNAQFGGRPITSQNLSEWVRGGYRDWLFQEQALELVRRMKEDDTELAEAGDMKVVDLLARRLTARFIVLFQEVSRLDGDPAAQLELLHRLGRDVAALRRSDQWADRMKLERDRLQLERDQFEVDQEADRFQWAWQNSKRVVAYLNNRYDRREKIERAMHTGNLNQLDANEMEDPPPAPEDPAIKPNQT